jgi:hypothetical protein
MHSVHCMYINTVHPSEAPTQYLCIIENVHPINNMTGITTGGKSTQPFCIMRKVYYLTGHRVSSLRCICNKNGAPTGYLSDVNTTDFS